jgi:hypothetical protein
MAYEEATRTCERSGYFPLRLWVDLLFATKPVQKMFYTKTAGWR